MARFSYVGTVTRVTNGQLEPRRRNMNKMNDKDLEKVAGGGPGTNLQDLFAATNFGASGARKAQGVLIEDEPPADGSNQGVDRG